MLTDARPAASEGAARPRWALDYTCGSGLGIIAATRDYEIIRDRLG
jgi:hypothetical protein|eukprot:COSAG02_NODE_5351_length_4407_cov_4.772516_2_plen_46_part_00